MLVINEKKVRFTIKKHKYESRKALKADHCIFYSYAHILTKKVFLALQKLFDKLAVCSRNCGLGATACSITDCQTI